MGDVFTPEKRSKVMSRITGKDTEPEIKIRKALHGLGYRYSLHKKKLPGSPDLYFKKYNAVIEINGCFWHAHDCHLFKMPKTRTQFWKNKLERNRERDRENIEKLVDKGYRILVIWECAVKGKTSLAFEALIDSTISFLHSEKKYKNIEGEEPE